jgi:hypothetical protein
MAEEKAKQEMGKKQIAFFLAVLFGPEYGVDILFQNFC